MSADVILEPEIKLIREDEFYVFYEMLMQSLKTEDVKEGINKSLLLLRLFLKSGDISLYKKNEYGVYTFRIGDSKKNELMQPVGCIINKTKHIAEQKGVFNLDLQLSNRLKNLTLIHERIGNTDCVLSIVNNQKELEPIFWARLSDTLHIILKRAASYEKNTSAITTDLLTGLDNRNSYEMRVHSFDENEQMVLGVFDLFRLKYINDNYSHLVGDEYIKKVANILNRYWPKQTIKMNDDSTESFINTGHCLYRYGGDEFVLFTTVEDMKLTDIKAGLAAEEVEMIDLGLGEDVPLGLNYGLARHNPGDAYKKTFGIADDLMQEDKKNMYLKYKLERRK